VKSKGRKQMQMLNRLLIITFSVLVLSGCVKRPVEKLNAARISVARAYANGAADYAPGEYQLASSALAAAEKLIGQGEYSKAGKTLSLSSRYAEEALSLSELELQRIAAEKARQEQEQKMAEQKQQEELQARQQAELEKQQKKEKEHQLQQAKKSVTQKVVVEIPPEEVETTPVLIDQVEVLSGENLAMVAARPEVYGEAELWPLIYKANRDQIKDPQEIFAGQILVVPRDKSREDLDVARQESLESDLFH
jgi:nucleoid-associated protein YgaU